MADEKKHIDDLLRDALGDYAEVPPSGAWADMEARLPGDADHVDDLLREAFAGHTEMPPEGAWADMEARLTEKPTRRRGLIWFWLAATIVGVLIGGYWFLNKKDKTIAHKEQEKQVTETPVTDNVPATPVTAPMPGQPENKPAEESIDNTQQPTEPVTIAPRQNVPVNTNEQKSTPVVSTPREDKGTAQKDADRKPETTDSPVAQQQPGQTPEPSVTGNSTVKDSARTDEPVDDIAAAISKRGSGVVMNITKSPYADSMARIEEELKQKAMKIASHRPLRIAKSLLPVRTPDVAVSKPPVASTTVDSISDLAAKTISKTVNGLTGVNDANAPQAQHIPDVQFAAPADSQPIAAGDNDSDIGSLKGFIGPMPDTTNYLSDIKDMDPLMAEATIRERLFFDVFAKMGYERGFEARTTNKFVLGMSLQAHITDRFSLIFQPSFKTGSVNYSQLSQKHSYYDIESSYMDSIKSYSTGINSAGIIFDTVRAKYFYQQTHDSLVISHQFETRKIAEVELPILANYNVGRGWSVYGGPVLNYSSMLRVKENRETYHGATRRDTVIFPATLASESKVAPGINEVFKYNADNISKHNAAPYANSTVNKLRLGYMLGASWLYQDKLSIDLSVQQNLSRMNYIPNAGIRNIYLQPYMRFMVGYKLSGKKK